MAEGQESSQEKTEQPTPKRLRESKKKGQVPRSREFNSMAVMMSGAVALLIFAPVIYGGLHAMMQKAFSLPREDLFEPGKMLTRFSDAFIGVFWSLTPFLALMTVVALFAPIALGGWAFSTDQVAPKLERIDPIKGLKRVFSVNGLMELLKAVGKFLVVMAVAAILWYLLGDEYLGLDREPFLQAVGHAGTLFGWSFLALSASLVLIAAVDMPFQLWSFQQKQKMTLQEVRDEMKETEGRPEVKSKVRALQQEMSQRRMMDKVPEADVIITNPTHYAVALKYDPDNMDAPLVVALGQDHMALRIREVAKQHNIEIFEAPPLARALYASCELDQTIPAPLYFAVAQVLAFVFQLRNAREQGLDAPERPDPQPPTDERV